jgi:hypothetical protein
MVSTMKWNENLDTEIVSSILGITLFILIGSARFGMIGVATAFIVILIIVGTIVGSTTIISWMRSLKKKRELTKYAKYTKKAHKISWDKPQYLGNNWFNDTINKTINALKEEAVEENKVIITATQNSTSSPTFPSSQKTITVKSGDKKVTIKMGNAHIEETPANPDVTIAPIKKKKIKNVETPLPLSEDKEDALAAVVKEQIDHTPLSPEEIAAHCHALSVTQEALKKKDNSSDIA